MTLMIDRPRICNVIYNKRSNKHHPPTSPNTAPACACHRKGHAWLMPITYETSFTMRGATGITLQPHQKLRLPRKIALQNLREIGRKQLKRHLQCAANSTMVRTQTRYSHPPVRRAYFSRFGDAFCILRLPRKVTLQHHQILHLPRKVTRQHHQILCLPRKVMLQQYEVLRLPPKVTLNCYLTELLLDCTLTLLNCYLTWTVTLLSCYFTELLLYWAVTLLNCYLTELLLYWAVTLLSCYFTLLDSLHF